MTFRLHGFCVSALKHYPKTFFIEWKERFGLEILHGIGSDRTHAYFYFQSSRRCQTGKFRVKLCRDTLPKLSMMMVMRYLMARLVISRSNVNRWLPTTIGQREKTKTSILGEWFNTGDWYYRDAEGYYYCYGMRITC